MRFPEMPGWMRTRLMYALILTAALGFGVRFNDLISGSADARERTFINPQGLDVSQLEPAAGEEEKPAAAKPAEAAADKKEAPPPSKPLLAAETLAKAPKAEPEPPPVDWKDATDSDMEYSAVQMSLFEDLSKRRKELEENEKNMAAREALLQAAEKNLEQKYKELSDLRTEVQELLQQQSEEEKARVTSLVKIYEGMKAKDAARIFDTLDMDVLLQVIGKMSERKSAPVIAAMNPDRARSVTIMLAEQKALPTLEDEELQLQ